MKTEKPLIDRDCLLQKEDCKGSWTYIEFPDIPTPKTPFGMLTVKGRIDDYEFSDFNLMPTGRGHQFMTIKAGIRKQLKKEAPAAVHVTLYEDHAPLVIPQDLLLCMKDETGVQEKFETYSDGQKRACVKWIGSAKTEQTRADRIAKAILTIQKGGKFYGK